MMFASKIGIGTAQWGMRYGVSNESGQTSPNEVQNILNYAQKVGIKLIDTAPVYGVSEQVLGNQDLSGFNVVTKIPALEMNRPDGISAGTVQEIFEKSLDSLNVSSIYGLLMHSPGDLFSIGGQHILQALDKLKDAGMVQRIGISIYNAEEIKAILDIFKPDIIQLPVSVFDQRLIVDGTIDWLSSLGIEIHARSVFLQGLLVMSPDKIPDYFEPWKHLLLNWHQTCKLNQVLPYEAALSFVCSLKNIDHVIIGIESSFQLAQLIANSASLTYKDLERFAVLEQNLVNPTLWKL